MNKILINCNPWQTRVAILREDRLQDIFFDTHTKQEIERCYFKGRISKVLPGIQTAFVDIGQQRAGFLHITEVDRGLAADRIAEQLGEETDTHRVKKHMDISKVFRQGEEVLVQVLKEPVNQKGAKLTTCFTLPGRFVVLMPNIAQIGVSKKIEGRDERSRLREIIKASLPEKMGAIIRTTAEGHSDDDIKRDIAFQINIWNAIKRKSKKMKVGELIHSDLDISLRAVRDHLDEDVEMVLTDDQDTQKRVAKFIKNFNAATAHKIRYYQGPPELFDQFEINKQIEQALEPKVFLPSGGSVVIDSAEAMTVIDVNTGRFTGTGGLEDTILTTNLEAAEEIATQLRLRNIGGLIVIDFIDMASSTNRQKLSRHFEKMLRERDRHQSVTLKVSEFGLVQMTRKRTGKTLVKQMTEICKDCTGHGFVRSPSTSSYEVLRAFKQDVKRRAIKGSTVLSVSPPVFDHLTKYEYQSLLKLEKQMDVRIILERNPQYADERFSLEKP